MCRLLQWCMVLLLVCAVGVAAGCYVKLKCLQDSDCVSGERCELGLGTCQKATCQPKSATKCNATDGHLYWFDSCGQQGDLITRCPQGCEVDQCKVTTTCGKTCDQSCTCPGGLFCVAGICALCRQDSDCSAGNSCSAGQCLPLQGSCQSSADCTGGLSCLNQKCTACRQESDCENGMVCTNGTCTKGQGGCQTSVDCPSNQVCASGSCRVGQCVNDTDCDKGRCVSYICVPIPGCKSNNECSAGQVCVNEMCQQAACSDEGKYRCVGTQREHCRGGDWVVAPCQTGEFCSSGACVKSGCQADTDCASGERCETGKCVPNATKCTSDSGCPPAHICANGACQPLTCNGGDRKCVGMEIHICRSNTWSLEASCGGAQRCALGACTSTCATTADCNSGYICNKRSCEAAECQADSDCKNQDTCRSGRCCDCTGSIPTRCSPVAPGNHIEYKCVDKCRWVEEQKCAIACRPDFKECL